MRFVLELQRAIINSEMPATGRHVMLTLAIKADWETGVIPDEHTPSLSMLVAMTGLSKSTVAEWLDGLDAAGWIKRDRPPRSSKDERTRYTLLIGSSFVPKPQRASRRSATTASRPLRVPLSDTGTADTSPSGSPLGGPVRQADSSGVDESFAFGSPPGGQVRQADSSSGPPGGAAAVRPADSGGPPGGHASIRNSPSESSTSGGHPARPRGAAPRSAVGAASATSSRGTRIPTDFVVSGEMMAWARRETPNVGRAATDAFLDHWTHQRGEAGERTDWQYEWRRWMRREQKFYEGSPGFRGTPVQTSVDAIPAPRLDPDEICPVHRSGFKKANCGLCKSDKILAAWDLKTSSTDLAPGEASAQDLEPEPSAQ